MRRGPAKRDCMVVLPPCDRCGIWIASVQTPPLPPSVSGEPLANPPRSAARRARGWVPRGPRTTTVRLRMRSRTTTPPWVTRVACPRRCPAPATGAADRGGAVPAAGAERALAVAPQLARLRLLLAAAPRPSARGQRLVEREVRDPAPSGDAEHAVVRAARSGPAPGRGPDAQFDPPPGVDRRAERDVVERGQRDEPRRALQPHPHRPADRLDDDRLRPNTGTGSAPGSASARRRRRRRRRARPARPRRRDRGARRFQTATPTWSAAAATRIAPGSSTAARHADPRASSHRRRRRRASRGSPTRPVADRRRAGARRHPGTGRLACVARPDRHRRAEVVRRAAHEHRPPSPASSHRPSAPPASRG